MPKTTMDPEITASLERLREAILEALTSSAVCRAMDTLTEFGWNPTVSVDVTLGPAGQDHAEPTRNAETSDIEFLNSLGIVAAEGPEV